MRLPSPVIIPQRRITNRTRGFVCNYSSSLRNAGIDEKAFSTFINQLNRLAELKPRAQAIDFSGFAHLCYNTHYDIFISMAVGTAFETAKGIQHSTAMNKLIDKTNDELFKPKGLVCLLMTWESEGPEGSSLDRSFRSRPVQRVRNERRGMETRPKANLSPLQGMGMFEWLQPTTFKRIDGDANVLPETQISVTCNQYPLQIGGTQFIDSRTNQCLAVHHHLEHRRGSQVATVNIGVTAHAQEAIPFPLAEITGQSQGQISLNNLGRCSALEEKRDAKEEQNGDRYLRKDLNDMDPFNITPTPSFTTGALKALETETLYVLIANMPDDDETQRDTVY
ncbi:uncharacterized protein LY79DRAFT_558029 [Colletotrichum navitas]|uniref:Uncharacterized protein n=1 Tax=Colletotrichum navitas TaxID=681940 RepID=A0AAD8PWV9_9PEZI|nr:uncharacterized protein LY79DRAFT_558029 [Colletotrichum navitas]KAK1585658.1 hypothetical protein LY79DRAFT_558029 [Colletotrichum navitas]